MKTIGETMKAARLRRKYSKAKLEKETKIRKSFIEAIEKEEWEKLPEYPVVVGFVKNISSILRIDTGKMAALLRRDYPPKSLKINPKPDISNKFSWGPKQTFFVGIGSVLIIIFTYLSYQYIKFTSPPDLQLDSPKEQEVVKTTNIFVSGITDPEATVSINNQQVLIDDNGRFGIEIEISEKTKEVIVIATSRSGKETVINRAIVVEIE